MFLQKTQERAWILDLPELGVFANGFLNRMFSDATILKVGVMCISPQLFRQLGVT